MVYRSLACPCVFVWPARFQRVNVCQGSAVMCKNELRRQQPVFPAFLIELDEFFYLSHESRAFEADAIARVVGHKFLDFYTLYFKYGNLAA